MEDWGLAGAERALACRQSHQHTLAVGSSSGSLRPLELRCQQLWEHGLHLPQRVAGYCLGLVTDVCSVQEGSV
eukprot:1336930-Rhodomonas_salina.1